jgi:hypothetical protein
MKKTFTIIIFVISANLCFAQCVSGDCNDGIGTYKYENGDIYAGEWVNGMNEGKGKLTTHDGETYDGSWYRGKMHGEGHIVSESKSVRSYSGSFKWGLFNGIGEQTMSNDEIYIGEFINGHRNGHGILYYSKDDYWDGGFTNGKQFGFGTYYYSGGDHRIGTKNIDEEWHGIATFVDVENNKVWIEIWDNGKSLGRKLFDE